MIIWVIVLIIIFGASGGFVNAFLAHEGFILPARRTLKDRRKIWRPGFAGNALVGAVTAFVIAALYSPLGAVAVLGDQKAPSYILTIGALAGVVLSGIGGARLLTSEVDKQSLGIAKKQARDSVLELIKYKKKP